ncbi:palmitoyltransferase ZDHHC17-like [Antedon mediterranea]|uniref:palmitoyltransferase ZDHHC17-like n=1 Tax=Antedon mediterranea TaxID=105859 RepID=UPI003AF7CDA5
MSSTDHPPHHHSHNDGLCTCQDSFGVSQSLDELSFERGIWSAALNGEYERVKKLLKTTSVNELDTTGYTALHYASRSGFLTVCSLLLDSGADVNAKTRAGGSTSLHRSAYRGHLDVVKELLKFKADPSNIDEDGRTPLHKAAEGGHRNICEILLQIKPSLKAVTDKRGKQAWHYASDPVLQDFLQEK